MTEQKTKNKLKEREGDGLFQSRKGPTPEEVAILYDKSRKYKTALDLYDCVNTNENFYIGKQWEGVQANGLPTPVFNFLKKDVMFVVSSITSDNLKIQATPLAASAGTKDLAEPARVLNEEYEAIFERNDIVSLLREFARDAAVRGDGCIYTYWDPDAETGQDAKGAIVSETVENTRVHFGNPNDRRVQSQPWIIVESREIVRKVRKQARENGSEDWESISPDDDNTYLGQERRTDDKVTKLFTMWKDENGEVWGYECTQKAEIRKPWKLGIRRYPIVWLSWDYVADCYHGQAMLTGLIPNQIFVNKLWAMAMISLMTSAYPRVIYDRTRVPKWSNQVGAAIGINGGDVNSVARNMDPATISPQISQFIAAAIETTNSNLGVTAAATGEVRPDNTSAIIALQRAAATPSEITKQNLYKCVKDLARIYLEFIAEFYGKRVIDMETPEGLTQQLNFAVQAGLLPPDTEIPDEIQLEFDFSVFKRLPMQMKLDVGASSYYSEIAAMQTLDNLLMQKQINTVQYLERMPDGYIPDRRGLISELKKAMEMMQAAQTGMPTPPTSGEIAVDAGEKEPVQPGFTNLQRKITEGEDVR